MESGYARKPRKKPRAKAQREAHRCFCRAPRKRGLGKKTIELLAKAQGKRPLAKEALEEAMLKTRKLARKHFPLNNQGNPRTRRNRETGKMEPVGNAGTYLKLAEALARFACALARYQSPKLRALTVKEAPREPAEETRFTLNIFDSKIAEWF